MAKPLGRPRKWQEALCIEAVRRYEAFCLDAGKLPSLSGYEAWQREDGNAASAFTLRRTGHTWNELRILATDTPDEIKLNYPCHQRHWTEEEYISAVRRYQRELPPSRKATYEGYEAWQKGHDDVPSGRTILNLEGNCSWKDIIRKASLLTDEGLER